MAPKLGSTVVFTFSTDDRKRIDSHQSGVLAELGQGETVPATVVAAWSADCLNLRVHPDGPGPDLWYTSVTRKSGDDDPGPYWEPLE